MPSPSSENYFQISIDVFGYEVNRKGWNTTFPVCASFRATASPSTRSTPHCPAHREGLVAGHLELRHWRGLSATGQSHTLKFALNVRDRPQTLHGTILQQTETDPSKASKVGRFISHQRAKSSPPSQVINGEPIPPQRPRTVLEYGTNSCATQTLPKFAPSPRLTTHISSCLRIE